MARKSKLERNLEKRDARQPIGNIGHYDNLSRDELREEIYRNRQEAGTDGGTAMLRSNARAKLLERIGINFYCIDDIIPNPDNDYSMDEGSIEGLADLIYESRVTTPLSLIEIGNSKYKIIDGERRYRAHQLLVERHGQAWSMVPAQVFRHDELSDEDVTFMLNALNIGQRVMTQSERAKGYAAVADRLTALRKADPSTNDGRRIAEVMAEQFGVSARTANTEISIGRNLSDEGMELLDEGKITKLTADAISKLEPEEQHNFVGRIKSGELDKKTAAQELKRRNRKSTRMPKSTDDLLREAKRLVRRALSTGEGADRVVVAEIKNLLDKFES